MSNPNPHDLRTIIAFALNLADSLGVTVEALNADEYGNVTLYAWAEGHAKVDQVADAEGWTGQARDGESWHSREHMFAVAGRPVRIALIGDLPETGRPGTPDPGAPAPAAGSVPSEVTA